MAAAEGGEDLSVHSRCTTEEDDDGDGYARPAVAVAVSGSGEDREADEGSNARARVEAARQQPRANERAWRDEPAAAMFARELCAAAAVELGAGVVAVPMRRCIRAAEAPSPSLLVRASCRAVWDQVLGGSFARPGTHFAVAGAPGIGKSRSISYLLRELFRRGRTVVLEACADRSVRVFTPLRGAGAGAYAVRVAAAGGAAPQCAELRRPDCFYVIDAAGGARGAGRRVPRVAAHTVLVTATAGNPGLVAFMDRPDTATFFMPVWSADELAAAGPYLAGGGGDTARRLDVFGGVPAHVYRGADHEGPRQLLPQYVPRPELA